MARRRRPIRGRRARRPRNRSRFQWLRLLVLHLSQQDVSSAAEEIPSQLFLRLDHMVDLFLHGAATNELVHKHILGLSDPEGTVGGLVFDSRIPPPVEMNDMRGRWEI